MLDDTYSNMTGYSNLGAPYNNGTAHASNQANASFSYQCTNCTGILWQATSVVFGTGVLTPRTHSLRITTRSETASLHFQGLARAEAGSRVTA